MSIPEQLDMQAALIVILAEYPHGVQPTVVYPQMTDAFPALTAADMRKTTKDGRNYWINRIQWTRAALVEEGLLDNSKYGVWKLTQAGRTRVEALIEADAPGQSLATVRSMLITLLYQIDNEELPWSAERRDDGSLAIFYDGRLRVVVMA